MSFALTPGQFAENPRFVAVVEGIRVRGPVGRPRSRRMRAFADRVDWLTLVFLPPYAPDLNPVEGSWAHLKGGALANPGARTLDELVTVARKRGLWDVQHRPALLEGFLAATV
ncbi:transposase [Embleya sp. NPDC050493]|uniref:transposase n=1 Tax=Embleya sp. NPDC050493 TaxID=3363989 RepID=UPI0037B8E655